MEDPETKPRLPFSLCKRVIDATYDVRYFEESLATLSKCALVCREWRPHAQMNFFDTVIVRNGTLLSQLESLLSESPHLGGYVHRLTLRGYLHVPDIPATLFPRVVRDWMPNLTHVYLQEIPPEEEAETSPPANMSKTPLPLHPIFPTLLRTLDHVRQVDLVGLRFHSFGDLCRVIGALRGLTGLVCDNVSWDVFCNLPYSVSRAISSAQDGSDRKPFLPKLRVLNCYDMDEQGRQTLISSLGPSVSDMSFTFPNTPPIYEQAQNTKSEAEVKLSSVPNVSKLVFLLKPGLETDERAQKAIGATLQSWKVTAYAHNSDSLAHRQLYLRPWRGHDGNECSMKGFVDAVCKVGPLVEQVLCEQAPATEGSDKPAGMNVTVIVQLLGEDLEYGSRGRARVEEAFPTLSKLDRLSIISEDS